MALIKCSFCEKEISDKAKVCPQCGHPVALRDEDAKNKIFIRCEECGTDFLNGMEACPNCGCPVTCIKSIDEKPIQKNNTTLVNHLTSIKNGCHKKHIIIAIIVIVATTLITLFALGDFGKAGRYEKAVELMNAAKYEEALSIFSDLGDYENSETYKRKCEKIVALLANYDNADDLVDTLSKYYTGAKEELNLIKINKSMHKFFQEENNGLEMYRKINGIVSDKAIFDLFDVCSSTNWFWGIDAGIYPLAFQGNARLTRSSIVDDIKSDFKDPQSVSIESARFVILNEPKNGVYSLPMEYVVVATVRATNSFGGYVSDTYLITGNIGGRAKLNGKYTGIDVLANDIYYKGEYYSGWSL